MKAYVLIFLSIYGLSTFLLILVGFLRNLRKEKLNKGQVIKLDEVVVIVPFRNERHRIQGLITSIKNARVLPKKIVFIDDHSTDHSAQFIEQELRGFEVEVMPLTTTKGGKKEALRFGIENSESKYILTIDADVEFNPDYFERITTLDEADMFVLPAILMAQSPLQRLYEIDTILVNALNVAMAGWKRPIFASGANLLYRRACYHEVENYASHQHMASGDDTYLLRDFRNAQKQVRLVSDQSFGIFTETPQTIREFFDQRVRWAGKSNDVKDSLANALALFQFALSAAFILGIILLLIQGNWLSVMLLFMFKLSIDLVAYTPYFNRIGRTPTLLMLPIYELLFPLYFIVMLLLIAFYSPKWKGRPLSS